MAWSAPPGVWRGPEIKTAIAAAEAKLNADPGLSCAGDFLTGDARESWRVYISTFIQHSILAHLSLGDLLAGRHGALAAQDDLTRVRKAALTHYFGPGVDRFAIEYYAATQALLPHHAAINDDTSTITLYRGIAKNTAEVLFRDLALPGYQAHLSLNPLSSWSDKAGLPKRFAGRGGGAVVKFDVPSWAVFAYWKTDSMMKPVLERQCEQHLGEGPDFIGGEAIVWLPLSCLPITQVNIVIDRTQVPKSDKL